MRIALLALLSACVRLPHEDFAGDFDGDGFVVGTDCDDFDEDVHPGAVERCDGEDEDCDGLVDEDASDATLLYPDDDGDGWGDAVRGVLACDSLDGWTEAAGDCDDGDATRNPSAFEGDCTDPVDRDCDGRPASADRDGDGSPGCEDCDDDDASRSPFETERCNGIDDDCDGEEDEDLAGWTWYDDRDGDGYGDPATAQEACQRPHSRATLDGADCDDGSSDVHPDALETCDGEDDDCDGETDEPDDREGASARWYVDADGDGYGDESDSVASCTEVDGRIPVGGDCDDDDPSLSPDAPERCDGEVDENCDGEVDEGTAIDATLWYRDDDADGWGRDTSMIEACTLPSGYAAVGSDCDDARATTFPGADESCDAVDSDCDGETRDDESVDAPAWYPDGDGDGYGEDARAEYACDAPADRVADGGDCNDVDPAVHPAATETDCDDPVDYNCDGSSGREDLDGDGFVACAECDDRSSAIRPDALEDCATDADDDCDGDDNDVDALACVDRYADGDDDGWHGGDPLCTCVATEDYTSTTADDCDDADATASPGAEEIADDGVDNDCDGRVDEAPLGRDDAASVLLGREASAGAGTALLALPDGAAWIGVPDDGLETEGAGATYRVDPFPDGTDTLDDAGAALAVFAESAACGSALASMDAGLLLACPFDSRFYATGGVVYLTATDATGDLDTVADARIVGESTHALFGAALAGADLDGDGVDEAIVGAPYEDEDGTNAGAAWIFPGPLSGDYGTTDAVTRIHADISDAFTGSALAACDLDADGLADLVVGASEYDDVSLDSGVVGYWLGGVPPGDVSLADADGWLLGSSRAKAGDALACAGDTDGDGVEDLLVGASSAGTGGVAYLVPGPPEAASLSSEATSVPGTTAYDEAGAALAGAGDVDGDGRDDFWVGIPGSSSDTGAAWLLLGGRTGALTEDDARTVVHGEAPGDRLGDAISAGDLDGDGEPDVLLGAPDSDEGDAEAGEVWLLAHDTL